MVQLINTNPDSNNTETEIKNVGAENFLEEVIDFSKSVPVLVDFWAPWCEPCKNLTPILESLAKKHADAFRLVKVNIDDEQELAMQFQVRSVPTVYLVKDATVVDGFMGVQPESEVKAFLSKHINLEDESAQPKFDDPIQNLIDRGQEAEAIAALKKDASDDSRFRLARLYLNRNEFDNVRSTMKELRDKSTNPEYRFIEAALHFAELSYNCEPDDELRQMIDQDDTNWDAQYKLASINLVSGDFVEALERLLRIVENDRKFNDDAGRKGMVMAFDMIGHDHELVSQYRSSLARILH